MRVSLGNNAVYLFCEIVTKKEYLPIRRIGTMSNDPVVDFLDCCYCQTRDNGDRQERNDALSYYLNVLADRDRLRAMITHCDRCGGSWVDDGINAGCHCCKILELRTERDRLQLDLAGARDVIKKLSVEKHAVKVKLATTEAENRILQSERDFDQEHFGAELTVRRALQKERDRLREVLEFCLATVVKIIKRNQGGYIGDWEDIKSIRKHAEETLAGESGRYALAALEGKDDASK